MSSTSVENVISGTSQRPFEEKREENGEKKYEKYWKILEKK
jgi:hypothetical protein